MGEKNFPIKKKVRIHPGPAGRGKERGIFDDGKHVSLRAGGERWGKDGGK